MSIQDQKQKGDHSKLQPLDQYLYLACDQFLQSQQITEKLMHINPICGLSDSFCKFSNAFVDASLVIPHHIHETSDVPSDSSASTASHFDEPQKFSSQVNALKSSFSTSIATGGDDNSNNATVLTCDSRDVWQALVHCPTTLSSPDFSSIASMFQNLSTVSIDFSFHGTKTEEAVRSILLKGYNPTFRKGQSSGPGEYHTNVISTARGYGNYVIVNCLINHRGTTTVHGSLGNNIYVTNNPLAFNKLTYILPLGVVCFNVAQINLSSFVLPDVYTPPPMLFSNKVEEKKPKKWTGKCIQLNNIIDQAYHFYKQNKKHKCLSRMVYFAFENGVFCHHVLDFVSMESVNTRTGTISAVVRQ